MLNAELAPKFTGPHQITQLKGQKTVELKTDKAKKIVIIVDRLKPYHDPAQNVMPTEPEPEELTFSDAKQNRSKFGSKQRGGLGNNDFVFDDCSLLDDSTDGWEFNWRSTTMSPRTEIPSQRHRLRPKPPQHKQGQNGKPYHDPAQNVMPTEPEPEELTFSDAKQNRSKFGSKQRGGLGNNDFVFDDCSLLDDSTDGWEFNWRSTTMSPRTEIPSQRHRLRPKPPQHKQGQNG